MILTLFADSNVGLRRHNIVCIVPWRHEVLRETPQLLRGKLYYITTHGFAREGLATLKEKNGEVHKEGQGLRTRI